MYSPMLLAKPFDAVPAVITGFQAAQTANSRSFSSSSPEYNLAWEMLPDAALKDVKVWEAMVANKSLPLTAALRNLGRMSDSMSLTRLCSCWST